MNCELSYIGETGRKFSTRLEEHKTEVEKVCKKVITRAGRKESLTTTHKSAITDHVVDKKTMASAGGNPRSSAQRQIDTNVGPRRF